MSSDNVPQEDIEKVVLVAVIGYQAINQLEQYWHLFNEITAVNLNISGRQTKELIKVSPLRKKLKGFIEISLNFVPFIESVYCSSSAKKQNLEDKSISFVESLSSFLTSFSKFHQFQLSLLKNSSANTLGESIKQRIQQKLTVLESHKCQQYTSASSPRIKVLILQRKIDQMSPLLYSYHYGAIAEQIDAFKYANKKLTTNSNLYKALFPLDIAQASALVQRLAKQKAENQKQKFELHQFQKAKKIIANHYDENTSPQEIQLQIQVLKSIKQFCQRRTYNTILQQTILNARSQTDFKMTPSKVIDFVVEWSTIDIEKYKPSADDYNKIVILSYMVNSFWFWQRRILNAGLQKESKEKIVNFCKKVEGKFKPLQEKPQGEQRFDLYRHLPLIVKEAKSWINNDKSENYVNASINQSSINRQSKRVIAIKGPLGYGELSMLLRQLKSQQKSSNCIIFCQSLVTTKEYLKIILKQKL